jgi:membrane protein DedA with SNARE-associated domain
MHSIEVYGPWSVFVGVIIESVIAPIPSPLVIMGAGFLLIRPDLTAAAALGPIALLIVLPGAVASTLGAYIGYGVGYLGGKPLIARWDRWFGFGWQEVELMERRLRGGKANAWIFFLRAVPIFPLSVISAAAGVLRLPPQPFTLWTFLGSVPRCLLLGYLGWWFGETYHHFARGIDRAETIVSAALLTGIIAAILWLRRRVRAKLLTRS